MPKKFPPGGFHLPGHNFLGPGTTVLQNIALGLKPVDEDDYVAQIHDLDYQFAQSWADIYEADWRAIKNFPWTFHGVLGKIGLTLRASAPFTTPYFIGHDKGARPLPLLP